MSEARPETDGQCRVLQLALSLNPGGTERLIIDIVKQLAPEMPMAVCCLDEEGTWAAELKTQGIQVTALRREPGFRPGLGRAVAHAIRQHRANVIHCHHYSPFVYSCLARLWQPSCRVVFTEHGRLGDAGPSRKRRVANALLARFPCEVYAVSEDLKRYMVAEGFPDAGVGVIYNGISIGPLPDAATRTSVRSALGLTDRTLAVGTIARLDPVKDLATLIRAVDVLRRSQSATLLVIGDGSERNRLEALVTELGAHAHVRFLGHREDARRLLAGCDVYVNSSVSEGVSLTILEAMAARLPVVATAVGGTPEVVNAACGRLIPAHDPSAIARALEELASQPGLREELGQAGRRRVETQFALDRMVLEYRDAYLHVASRH